MDQKYQMKPILILISFLLIVQSCFADKVINLQDSRVKFNINDEVLLKRRLPKFNNRKEKIDFLNNKIYLVDYSIYIHKLNEYHPTAIPLYIRDKKNLDKSKILSFLNKENKPILYIGFDWGIIMNSFSPLEYKNEMIGEKYFSIPRDEMRAPRNYQMDINFLHENKIISLYLIFADHNFTIPKKYPEYFIKKNGQWQWRSEKHITFLYEDIVGEKSIPELEKLIVYMDEICNSLVLY